MVKQYIPKQGDIVILTFDSQAGHEQQGRRPALIVSNEVFNKNVGLAIACPITNTDRSFPFHLKVDSSNLTGYVMCEQVKSIDYNARKVKFVEKASDNLLSHCLGIIESVF
ncbi:MAG: type II toxin-antitoxin system PemK/MazF family toxin [Campylobacterota bacterium]|nr:type II toxin-antitoxin system PemK/MazF family toxin [Campylobacterota bacterium]